MKATDSMLLKRKQARQAIIGTQAWGLIGFVTTIISFDVLVAQRSRISLATEAI